MGRNRRAVISTVLFSVIVALAGSLVLFLGSSAQAAGRPAPAKAQAAKPAKVQKPALLSEILASTPWVGDDFGWSVSVSGSTAVVGAPYSSSYTGAAYVFTDVAGTWIQDAVLAAS